jgi:hypothetical protein
VPGVVQQAVAVLADRHLEDVSYATVDLVLCPTLQASLPFEGCQRCTLPASPGHRRDRGPVLPPSGPLEPGKLGPVALALDGHLSVSQGWKPPGGVPREKLTIGGPFQGSRVAVCRYLLRLSVSDSVLVPFPGLLREKAPWTSAAKSGSMDTGGLAIKIIATSVDHSPPLRASSPCDRPSSLPPLAFLEATTSPALAQGATARRGGTWRCDCSGGVWPRPRSGTSPPRPRSPRRCDGCIVRPWIWCWVCWCDGLGEFRDAVMRFLAILVHFT